MKHAALHPRLARALNGINDLLTAPRQTSTEGHIFWSPNGLARDDALRVAQAIGTGLMDGPWSVVSSLFWEDPALQPEERLAWIEYAITTLQSRHTARFPTQPWCVLSPKVPSAKLILAVGTTGARRLLAWRNEEVTLAEGEDAQLNIERVLAVLRFWVEAAHDQIPAPGGRIQKA